MDHSSTISNNQSSVSHIQWPPSTFLSLDFTIKLIPYLLYPFQTLSLRQTTKAMESKSQSGNSGDCISNKRSDGSSAFDSKTISKTDVSSTPTEAKRFFPDSRERMPIKKTRGSSAMNLMPNLEIDGSSKPKETANFSRNAKQSTGQASASSAIPTKPHGKAVVSDENGADVMFFADVTQGPHQAELQFRLIHFWEARNPHTKRLIGEEMLLIDEKGTAIQGFIPAEQVEAHLPRMKAGCVYSLKNFFGSKSKVNFRVADQNVTVTFSWNSVLTLLESSPVSFPQDRFQFYRHEEFEATCDSKGDLYDYIGHMNLVNGQSITDTPTLDEVDITDKRRVLIHVQTQDGPVMKLYLWDNAATAFCQKFKSYGTTPRVLLVTTVYPKRLGGTLVLTSMSSSRVFMNADVQPSREYLSWLSSNSDIADKVNAEVVTKPESVTISDLFAYMKQDTAKVAWFECTATINDVLQGSAWYYISCGGCNTKAAKGPTSFTCPNKKCLKSEVIGVAQYLTKISVYDKSEHAVFVLLGNAGCELTGKHASELVANYFECDENLGPDDVVPVPQALLDTIGHTHRFIVKVSDHNLKGKTQAITVTKVLPAEPAHKLIEDAGEEANVSDSVTQEEAKSGY